MMSWMRPVLCRICEFPVADSGVRVDQLDTEKLSEWWKRKLNDELEYFGLKNESICQFCLWEARLEHESSEGNSEQTDNECNWWAGHDTDTTFYQHFYLREEIRPCKVVLYEHSSISHCDIDSIKSNDQDAENFECDPTKRRCRKQFPTMQEKQSHVSKFHVGKKYGRKKAECIVCDEMICINQMKAHVRKNHDNHPFIRCTNNNYSCITYFRSQEQKAKHDAEFHTKGEWTKCVYCGSDVKRCILSKHMRTLHKSIAVRCNFNKLCPTYFNTEEERSEHVQSEHRRTCWDGVECVYCKKICRDNKALSDHVSSVHWHLRIKCGVHRCCRFFLSQEDCDSHFEQKHRPEEEKKKFRCHDCGYRALSKLNLTKHVSQKHLKSRFRCPMCVRVLRSKCAVGKHVRKVHVESQQCQFCDMKVKLLKQHQKQLHCKVCNEMLPCLTSAAQHGVVCEN